MNDDMKQEENNGSFFRLEENKEEGFEKRIIEYWLLWNQWQEKYEKMGVQFHTRKNETEPEVEKSPFWQIKNDTLTTKPLYRRDEKEKRESDSRKEYVKSQLKTEVFEAGLVTEVQIYVERLLKEDMAGTQSMLQTIYLEEFEHAAVFVNLLQMISQIEYKLIKPAGPIMALAATRHKNCEVREYGLRCYENWEDRECLPVLKALHFEEKWLQNYLELLILDFD